MSWDALYYYYKPDYLNLVADTYNCADWTSYTTRKEAHKQIPGLATTSIVEIN